MFIKKFNEGFKIVVSNSPKIPNDNFIEINQQTYIKLINHELYWSNGTLKETENQEVRDYERYLENKSRIKQIYARLKETEQKAIFYLEGFITGSEYNSIKNERRSLVSELKSLEHDNNELEEIYNLNN